MKILRKIVVMSSVTGGEGVDRYICSRCGKEIKDSIRKNNNKRYSKLIYIDKCNECSGSDKKMK